MSYDFSVAPIPLSDDLGYLTKYLREATENSRIAQNLTPMVESLGNPGQAATSYSYAPGRAVISNSAPTLTQVGIPINSGVQGTTVRPPLVTRGANGYMLAPDGPARNTMGKAGRAVANTPRGKQFAGMLNSGPGRFLTGRDPKTQALIAREGAEWLSAIPGVTKARAAAITGSKLGLMAGRLVPGLSVAGNVMDVADIIAGPDSFGNKAMDAAGMVIGGTIGGVLGGGPLGASIGASTGKMASDGLQWLFGDKKTAEQRKLEEALVQLGYL